jgi:hypothetical protein
MEIRNVTAEHLEFAAHEAHVRMTQGGSWGRSKGLGGGFVEPVGCTRQGGRVWRLTLRTARDESGKVVWGRRGFARNKDGSRRRVPGPVCWHGHRAFMRALFKVAPHAVIISSLARYNDAEDFERKHGATADHPAGSYYDPVTVANLCDCKGDTPVTRHHLRPVF